LLRNAQKSPEYQEIEITVLIGVRSSAKGILTQSHIPSLEKNSVKWMEDHDLTFCGKVLFWERFEHPRTCKEWGESGWPLILTVLQVPN